MSHVYMITAFYRRPILALIRMVHFFACEAQDSLDKEHSHLSKLFELAQSGDKDLDEATFYQMTTKHQIGEVRRETCNEHIAAHQVGNVIIRNMSLTWEAVTKELDTFKAHWAFPGEPIDLSFLEMVRKAGVE
jgi:hypothetical protein